jgi:hypothetical protein
MRIALAPILLLAAVPAYAQESPEMPAWMAGCWEQVQAELWSDECWTGPRAGMMIGAARTGSGETLQFFEHSRVETRDDGSLAFVAMPRGAAGTAFVAEGSGSDWIEFVNPANDYPQRVRYWREGTNLRARISLMDGSNPAEWTFVPMGG